MLTLADKAGLLEAHYDLYGPFRFVVETGLWNGHGSAAPLAARPMTRYVAIELDPDSVARGLELGLDVLEGDSGELLPGVLAKCDGPALIWLDAHHVVDAGDELDGSPLERELAAILAWPWAAASVVLVDDVRLFDRWNVSPAMFEGHGWATVVADDVLRCIPAGRFRDAS